MFGNIFVIKLRIKLNMKTDRLKSFKNEKNHSMQCIFCRIFNEHKKLREENNYRGSAKLKKNLNN
jgi:hypothetical protein